MSLVADHEVPATVRRAELGLHVLVARELVEPGDGEIVLQEPIAGARSLQLVVGDNFERQLELSRQLVLPLLDQAAGADDEAALQVAPCDELLDEQPGHDGLAGTGIVGQKETQRLPGQHGLVDRGDLMGKGFDERSVNGQHRVKQVGEPNSLRLGDETEERAVGVEAPGAAGLDHFETRLVVAVKELVGDVPGGILVGEFKGVRAIPLDADDRDEPVRRDAADARGWPKILKLGQLDAPTVLGGLEKGTRWRAAGASRTAEVSGGIAVQTLATNFWWDRWGP